MKLRQGTITPLSIRTISKREDSTNLEKEGWEKFTYIIEFVVVLVVQEFYANAKELQNDSLLKGEMVKF